MWGNSNEVKWKLIWPFHASCVPVSSKCKYDNPGHSVSILLGRFDNTVFTTHHQEE